MLRQMAKANLICRTSLVNVFGFVCAANSQCANVGTWTTEIWTLRAYVRCAADQEGIFMPPNTCRTVVCQVRIRPVGSGPRGSRWISTAIRRLLKTKLHSLLGNRNICYYAHGDAICSMDGRKWFQAGSRHQERCVPTYDSIQMTPTPAHYDVVP